MVNPPVAPPLAKHGRLGNIPEGTGHYLLASLMMVVFLVTVIFALLGARHQTEWTGAKDALNVLLPIETGFLGSVIGYYFGSKK